MANLTITVDPETLQEARMMALRSGTTVNRMLNEYLQGYVGRRQRQMAAVENLERLADQARFNVGPIAWTRDELHERG